jgi:hypothetical protein
MSDSDDDDLPSVRKIIARARSTIDLTLDDDDDNTSDKNAIEVSWLRIPQTAQHSVTLISPFDRPHPTYRLTLLRPTILIAKVTRIYRRRPHNNHGQRLSKTIILAKALMRSALRLIRSAQRGGSLALRTRWVSLLPRVMQTSSIGSAPLTGLQTSKTLLSTSCPLYETSLPFVSYARRQATALFAAIS